jgi:hypothetical protein
MLTPRHRAASALSFVFLVLSFSHASASGHRSALSLLNEPCADITDTYAWVSNSTHDKLYLIMNFNANPKAQHVTAPRPDSFLSAQDLAPVERGSAVLKPLKRSFRPRARAVRRCRASLSRGP